MTDDRKIPNSLRDVEVDATATQVGEVVGKIKDMDAQRIARDDGAIVRKAVIALLPVIADLEARVRRLEAADTP